MAVMTTSGPVLRIYSDSPTRPELLIPAQRGGPSIAASLPIQRDRRARRARRGSTRRLVTLAVAFGLALLTWLAIIAGVMIIAGSAS